MKFMLAAATAAFALSATGAQATNLLANSGFESGALAPWSQINDFTHVGMDWTVTDTASHSGTYAAIVYGNKELGQTIAGVSGALVTQVSFWQKHPDGNMPTFVELFFSDNTTAGKLLFNGPDWTFVDMTDLVNPSKTLTGIGIWGFCCSGSSQTLVDDVVIDARVAPVPEPANWALMTIGLFGVGGYMRRRQAVRYSLTA